MAEREWTAQQKDCIKARGGTVVVSAAAGSGKTAVLIARIISLLTDPVQPTDIDRLLVVTFTKPAAAEMRMRLNDALSDLLARDPHNRRLLRQQMLLPQATICTIDSFCTQLLREQAQQADISPRFRVAEEAPLKLMQAEIAAQVIEEAYRHADPAFLQVCDLLAKDKSDKALTEQMLRLYDFIQAHPFPLRWLDAREAPFREDVPVGDTVWGRLLREQVCEQLDYADIPLKTAISLAGEDERTLDAYQPVFIAYQQQLHRALAALRGDWDTAVSAIAHIHADSVKALRHFDDEGFKQTLQELWKESKARVAKAQELFRWTQADAARDTQQAAPCVSALFDLVRHFQTLFSAAKAEKNWLDFNDLEHKALALLAVPDGDGYARTPLAREIGMRFDAIMVDEYQDTNATQDTLFSVLSDNEKNLFLVGDIKQSIYAFRQAMPDIFKRRREQSAAYDGTHFPASITLGNNFRSRPQVAAAVNFLFRRLMTAQAGGITYDDREALVASGTFPHADSTDYNTELLAVSNADSGLADDEAEARAIGQRILALFENGFQVTETKEQLHPLCYGDICILLRASTHTASYLKALQEMGIPACGGHDNTFFECAEILLAISLLKAIDNPLLDVPLLAVMLSPLYGFLPDDLAAIRTISPKAPLFVALRKASLSSLPLAEKCGAFLAELDRYRMLAAAMPADQLLRRVYEDTAILSVMSARSGGTQRIANLRRLYDYARHFEQNDFRALPAFIRYIDRLQAQNINLTKKAAIGSSNAVRLMTMHSSKGLEFPVVFVAGLGGGFNNKSTTGDVLLHAEYGIGLVHRDRQTLVKSNTIHKQAIAAAIRRSERSEELRILYVAATRAKDKLILVNTDKRLASTLQKLSCAPQANGFLPPSAILNASGMGNWVLTAALCHPGGDELRAFGGCADMPVAAGDADAGGWDIHVVTPPKELPQAAALNDTTQVPVHLEEVGPRLTYTYPYAVLGRIPSKLTASETAHRDTGDAVWLARPALFSADGLTPAQRGTAVHTFMQHADFSADILPQAQAMVDSGILTAAEQRHLPLKKLQAFFDSALCARMKAASLLLREFPFAVDCPVTELPFDLAGLPADGQTETVMVQGIADCVFEEDGGLIIVDYKTDRVSSGDELAKRYRPQLTIYRQALSQALQRPVRECLLYSFALGTVVPLT